MSLCAEGRGGGGYRVCTRVVRVGTCMGGHMSTGGRGKWICEVCKTNMSVTAKTVSNCTMAQYYINIIMCAWWRCC